MAIRSKAFISEKSYSGQLGVALVALGACCTFYAYYQYCFKKRELDNSGNGTTCLPVLFLTICILVIGMLLISYLIGATNNELT